jgi:hypothetical protein
MGDLCMPHERILVLPFLHEEWSFIPIACLLGEEHRLERGSRACVQHQNAEDFWELKQTTFSGSICLTMFDPFINQYKTSSKIQHVDWQRTFATEPDTVARCWEHFGNML